MLTRLGRFTVRRRRLVLSFTVLFMVAAAVLGTRAFGVLQDDGFADPSSESSRADAVLDARFDTAEPNVLVVVTAEGGDVDDPAVAAAADDLADAIRAVPHVVDVTSYWDLDGAASLRSTDGDRALVLTTLEADGDDEDGRHRGDPRPRRRGTGPASRRRSVARTPPTSTSRRRSRATSGGPS